MRTAPDPTLGRAPLLEDPRLGEFLAVLDAPLVGFVPYADRARLRDETRFHLENLSLDLGSLDRAMDAFGDPETAARDYLDAWSRKRAKGPIDRRLGYGAVRALAAFGGLQFLCTALIGWRTWNPVGGADDYLVDPARFHDVFPRAIPAPEATASYALLAGLAIVGPLVAGWFVGREIPLRPARAVYEGIAPCVLYSFLVGLLLMPSRDHVALGAVQIAWWLPAAAIAASLASIDARRRGWRREAR